jgi:hypothetical protein
MATAASRLVSPAIAGFRDGFGQRQQLSDPQSHQTFEILALRRELTAVQGFEFGLRERVNRLVGFRHASFARVRAVDRSKGMDPALLLVSDYVPGARLSEILSIVERRRAKLDLPAALCLIRQLVAAVAALHQYAPDVAHGGLAFERLVVTPDGRLIVVEYVCGSAIEKLAFSSERYWKQLRVALPALLPRCDQRADITQIGVVALSLILGRRLTDNEYPGALTELVSAAWASAERVGGEPLPIGFRAWMSRALQIDPRASFASAIEALSELDKICSDIDEVTGSLSLETFLVQYQEVSAGVTKPAPSPVEPAPIPVEAVPVPVESAPEESAPVATVPLAAAAPVAPAVSVAAAASMTAPAPVAFPTTPVVAPVAASVAVPAEPEHAVAVPIARFAAIDEAAPKHDDFVVSKREHPLAALNNEHLRSNASKRGTFRHVALAVAAMVILGAVFVGWRYLSATVAAGPAMGRVTVTTNVPGASVSIDGRARGVTPVAVTLSAGSHTIDLRGPQSSRTIPIRVTAGGELAQYIELASAVSGSARGQLHVRTTPSGVAVSVDGVPRGVSPLTIEDLSPGAHTVIVASDGESVTQEVTVQAGAVSSLTVPLDLPKTAAASGWISVSAPAEVQLAEAGHVLGTSRSDRIMVAPGKHNIDITADALGYKTTRVVDVAPGKVASIKLDWPRSSLSVNALPWADVTIDGERIGETPIANVSLPIGSHDVLFRHPELGEQRRSIVVTLTAPARVSVDMRAK